MDPLGSSAWRVERPAAGGTSSGVPSGATLDRLRAVGRGEEPGVVRLSRPRRLVAFGRRDELNPGFAEATARCEELGFDWIVRKVGGRAAAYHEGCLVVDVLAPDPDATSGNMRRYRAFGELYADALRGLGIDAGIGELPREYCPGEYSVHGRLPSGERTKLVGTAQRVVAGAWWFSAAVVVTDREPLARVLAGAYDALGLDLDPDTVGAVEQFVPEARVEDVEDAVVEAFGLG